MWARFFGRPLLGLLVGCAGGSDNSRDTAAEIGDPTQAEESTGQSTGMPTTASAASTATSGDDENCVPGQQIECACPGGSPGAQACLPDGSGFGACMCPGEDTGTSATGTTTIDDTTTADAGSESSGGTTECEACATMALDSSCAMQFDACLEDADCTMMANCVQGCGLTIDCANGCSEGADDQSLALFQDLISCVTESCPACGNNGG